MKMAAHPEVAPGVDGLTKIISVGEQLVLAWSGRAGGSRFPTPC